MLDTKDYGYLQHGKAGEPMRTERVLIKNEYADRWLAHYEGRWRRVHADEFVNDIEED